VSTQYDARERCERSENFRHGERDAASGIGIPSPADADLN
jgi:hypothetical protein